MSFSSEFRKRLAKMADAPKVAEKNAPSVPLPSDEWEPTNPALWNKVLDVAKGRKSELTQGERTIHAPNNGRGYEPWPHPNGTAWAVKQYNGFHGNWKKQTEASDVRLNIADEDWRSLERMRLGAYLTTKVGSVEDEGMVRMELRGLVSLQATDSQANRIWDITRKGSVLVTAGLGDELSRRMDALLTQFDPAKSKELGEWIESTFRVNSPKTPKGGKELKEKVLRLVWVLKHRVDSSADPEAASKAREEVAGDWADVEPQLDLLVSGFSDEGGKIVPKELNLDDRIYINEVGFDEATLNKFARRLEVLFESVKGWRRKALVGTMKVVLASPRSFHGTVGGKYRSGSDEMMVRATPSVLKRAEGYASFDYILIHELGHRYEHKVRGISENFDQTKWHTTRYSMSDGESFAELFALSHFRLSGPWDSETVERFEQVMGS